MKRVVGLILALLLCFSLCACKSKEAEKADELILAIGTVTLDSEDAITAAQVYVSTLDESQKQQVENLAVLEAAQSELAALKAEAAALKAEAEYQNIYESALAYEEKLMFSEAYSEYEKLPADYNDVAERMKKIKPIVQLEGTWVCDDLTVTSNKGVETGAVFKEIKFIVDSYGDTTLMRALGDYAGSDYTNNSIFKGYIDFMFFIGDSSLIPLRPTENADGSVLMGVGSAGNTNFGTLTTNYSITAAGKLLVEYIRDDDGNVTKVTFTYTKQ